MGLFSRRQKQYALPAAYGRHLTAWGEYLTGDKSRAQAVQWVTGDLTVLDFAQQDPAGFVDAMAGLVASHGGAPAVGANEMIHQVLGIDIDRDSRLAVIDAALDYLHGRRVPWGQLKPYMQARWRMVHGPESW